jgi:hypothetical protein
MSKLEVCFDRCVSAYLNSLGKVNAFDVVVKALSTPIICVLNCYRKEIRLSKKVLNEVVKYLSFTHL